MQTQMQLVQDKELEEDLSPYNGKYLGTFFSARGQVRADLFDDGSEVTAYVSFPTGLDGSTVEDRYVGILNEYAESQGFADHFRWVYYE
jgi:hypothetical protein